MAGSDISAYNYSQGSGAVLIGPSRSRISAAPCDCQGSFTITNGNGGATMLTQKFPAGMNEVYIPANGMLFTSGVFISALTGSGVYLTFLLA